MIKFNLCYSYNRQNLLIPLFLEDEALPFPEDWDWHATSSQDTLTFHYKFNSTTTRDVCQFYRPYTPVLY
ncbi:MAG: hypothetical protein ACFFC7_24180 [Candidatus Hermodarchaeota archaeon]